uniref:Uncharacterized protein n=1 Tax=Loigolactobacillus rennini TaxID=238013 RepID=A0A1K2I878_9LACO|nr:hypothetical protein LREN565_1677 [Loigolactobacillus rennini]
MFSLTATHLKSSSLSVQLEYSTNAKKNIAQLKNILLIIIENELTTAIIVLIITKNYFKK